MNNIWDKLQNNLKPYDLIPNWTMLKGYFGDSMKVVKVNQDDIIVHSPKAKNLQRISRDEFEKIWDIWPAYKAKQIQRQQIREFTFHSKYIISIFKWLDDQQ